jgi:hypothetical protein
LGQVGLQDPRDLGLRSCHTRATWMRQNAIEYENKLHLVLNLFTKNLVVEESMLHISTIISYAFAILSFARIRGI